MKFLVPALAGLFAMTCASAQDLGSAVSTDDICAQRPDLCSGNTIRHKKRKKRAKPSRDLDFSDFEDKRESAPKRQAQSGRGPTSFTAQPSRRSISFETYLNANHGHDAISGRHSNRQDAFQIKARPAVITGPSTTPAPGEGAPPDANAPPAPNAAPPGATPTPAPTPGGPPTF